MDTSDDDGSSVQVLTLVAGDQRMSKYESSMDLLIKSKVIVDPSGLDTWTLPKIQTISGIVIL